MDVSRARDLYYKYAAAVAYVAVRTAEGDESIGTAFHLGSNVWLTARHVVEGSEVVDIATTRNSIPDFTATVSKNRGVLDGTWFSYSGRYRLERAPMLHPDPTIDVALLKLEGPAIPGMVSSAWELWGDRGQPTPVVQLGGWLDDWLGDELVLEPVVVMGYPPIPMGREPLLVTTRAEINGVVDPRHVRHPHFILSAMARGGFSGSLVMTSFERGLGVTTASLVMNAAPVEHGYFAVLSVEPIYECLDHFEVLPPEQEFAKATE